MGFDITTLWKAPDVNPINKKARSIPFLNPIDPYGRVFLFSWMGFMLAFWAWYTFPPLLTETIKTDLNLTPAQIANSNIVSLVATFFLRFLAGPLCDRFGPRMVFTSLLLLGCLPIGLAPLVSSANGLYASRFFIGVLGATFVPCQVWTTGFFDKNIVGTANAFAGGFGNAGGGITYFIMPAVFDSLVANQGLSDSKAWRVTFVVPLICLIACGLGMLFLCPDSPVGKWSERAQNIQSNLGAYGVQDAIVVDVPGVITDRPISDEEKGKGSDEVKGNGSDKNVMILPLDDKSITRTEALQTAQGETVLKPTLREALPVIFSGQTLFHVSTYACSFGGELAVDAIMSAYYAKNFPNLGQTKASDYAAIFGFLNCVTRPLGGIIADVLYNRFGRNLWHKKAWITTCGVLSGIMFIVMGKVNPSALNGGGTGAMIGLVAVTAIFIEAGNGANFALVPHVHPSANGIISGLTGGGGNLGGVIFAIIFRFVGDGSNYARGFWIIGIIHIVVNVVVCWIPPIPKGQLGGH